MLYDLCYIPNVGGGDYVAVFMVYDEASAYADPAQFDPILGEPLFNDVDGDGVGEYDRTAHESEVKVRALVSWPTFEDQQQDRSGHLPLTSAVVSILRSELVSSGLLRADGRSSIGLNDRLVRVEDINANVLLDLTLMASPGLHVRQVRPALSPSEYFEFLCEYRARTSST